MTEAIAHEIIADSARLAEFCGRMAGHAFIVLDTEFIRERTYWPLLCLVQITDSTGEHAAAIDTLAPELNLAPLFALLADRSILKVFHAARQDLEIFHFLTGSVPSPVFDTQIAAQVCGMGDSISYEQFVGRLLGKTLDKGARFTDWSKRPLSDRQLDYAMLDVIYLREAYLKQKAYLERKGRDRWTEEEMRSLEAPEIYLTDENESWRRLKHGTRPPKILAVLREMARWRELEARERDVPRGRILKDDLLVEIAAHLPRSADELHHLRGAKHAVASRDVPALLACIEAALASDPAGWPKLPPKAADADAIASAVEMLALLLKIKAQENDVTPRLIADRDDLEAIARGNADVPALHGWRGEIFGSDALALLEGKLSLGYDAAGKKVALIRN